MKSKLAVPILTMLLSAVTVGYSQKGSRTKPAPRPPLKTIVIDEGLVQGKTYKNAALGIEFTPASNLRFEEPRLMGPPGKAPVLVTAGAWSQEDWLGMKEGTTFYAEELDYYPENLRSTDAYLRKVVRQQQNDEFKEAGGQAGTKLGGAWFARSDFIKGAVYEAIFVRACERWVFVFIFSGRGFEAVKTLISRADVKIDLQKSGCTS